MLYNTVIKHHPEGWLRARLPLAARAAGTASGVKERGSVRWVAATWRAAERAAKWQPCARYRPTEPGLPCQQPTRGDAADRDDCGRIAPAGDDRRSDDPRRAATPSQKTGGQRPKVRPSQTLTERHRVSIRHPLLNFKGYTASPCGNSIPVLLNGKCHSLRSLEDV